MGLCWREGDREPHEDDWEDLSDASELDSSWRLGWSATLTSIGLGDLNSISYLAAFSCATGSPPAIFSALEYAMLPFAEVAWRVALDSFFALPVQTTTATVNEITTKSVLPMTIPVISPGVKGRVGGGATGGGCASAKVACFEPFTSCNATKYTTRRERIRKGVQKGGVEGRRGEVRDGNRGTTIGRRATVRQTRASVVRHCKASPPCTHRDR